jgi:hypothetical protein
LLRLGKNQFGGVLEEFSKIIRQGTQTNRCEKVDGIPSVANIVFWEHASVPGSRLRILLPVHFKSFLQLGNSNGFGHFLNNNLDKDTRGRRGFVFIEMNNGQYTPRNRVGMQEMGK